MSSHYRREELEIEREARDKDVKSLSMQLDEERAIAKKIWRHFDG
jgi:hypothetical protein